MENSSNAYRIYVINPELEKLGSDTVIAELVVTKAKDGTRKFQFVKGCSSVEGEMTNGLRVPDFFSREKVTIEDPNFYGALKLYALDRGYELTDKIPPVKEKTD